MAERIGSILHGAYGDYYEQAICLKALKRARPELSLVLFFATASRMRELRVLDFGFADELHLAVDLPRVGVDRFLQFQVKDPELQADILAGLDSGLRNRIDDGVNRKPWSRLRSLNLRDPAVHIRLSEEGRRRLPQVLSEEGLASDIFATRPTVGFLWRYRQRGGAIAPWLQPPEAAVLATKSELLRRLQEQSGAHIIVAGMNLVRTEENRERVDAKFTDRRLDLDDSAATYLKGLSWGLELEILSRCAACIVMPSGFSEALWMIRSGPTELVDAPPMYLLKALWNRVPLFGLARPAEVLLQLQRRRAEDRIRRRLGWPRVA